MASLGRTIRVKWYNYWELGYKEEQSQEHRAGLLLKRRSKRDVIVTLFHIIHKLIMLYLHYPFPLGQFMSSCWFLSLIVNYFVDDLDNLNSFWCMKSKPWMSPFRIRKCRVHQVQKYAVVEFLYCFLLLISRTWNFTPFICLNVFFSLSFSPD